MGRANVLAVSLTHCMFLEVKRAIFEESKKSQDVLLLLSLREANTVLALNFAFIPDLQRTMSNDVIVPTLKTQHMLS